MEKRGLKKKPETLEEAIEYAVQKRLSAAKDEIEAEYKMREDELLQKIAALETQLSEKAEAA